MQIIRHHYYGAKVGGIPVSKDKPISTPPLPIEHMPMTKREYRPSVTAAVYFGEVVYGDMLGDTASHYKYIREMGYGWAIIDGVLLFGEAHHRVCTMFPDTSGVYFLPRRECKSRKVIGRRRVRTSWFDGECQVSFCGGFLVMHPLERVRTREEV